MFRIGTFELTPAEVSKRKEYLELSPADEQRLKEAHPYLEKHAQSIIDRFYDYLLGHEHTRAMLSAPGLVERLKKLQTQYFIELTSGVYDLAYFENRLRVGQVHHRIGLAPEWYLGAYIKYLHIASDILSAAFAKDHERFFQTLISLTKVISLDKGLALDAYHFSAQEGLEKKTRELENSNDELKRLQAAKRQLTDMIVHDLQNPLTGLTSALQVIRSTEPGVSESTRQALAEALRRCDDLSQMIMNVLQVSRGEPGELLTYTENLDAALISRQVAESFRISAELDGRTLLVDAPSEVALRSDQTLLKRILQNLIRNALRHTPRGTKVVVQVTRSDDQRTRLSVLDDGPGIPKEVQSHLFEPFGAAALRSAGVRVDTGLGLPSCLVMARALGAELAVESDGRRGCAFSLLLPVSPPDAGVGKAATG